MTNFIQLHVLTTFPVSNPNRSDDGQPKNAKFGGTLRGRISSQSRKRSIRTSDMFADEMTGHLGTRTREIGEAVDKHLADAGVPPPERQRIATSLINALMQSGDPAKAEQKAAKQAAKKNGKKLAPKPELDEPAATVQPEIVLKTDQLVFLSPKEIDRINQLALQMSKDATIKPSVTDLMLSADTAVDIGMFGRMLAQHPQFNREAAVQVAHAITTHAITVEDDYFTAVDDFKQIDQSQGAGHIGDSGFLSGVFYTYVCIDYDLLVRNLSGDVELAARAVRAFVPALMTITPTGKQASYASRTRASYVMVERGTDQPYTGATAFLKAVEADDVMAESISRLRTFRTTMRAAYGDKTEVAEFEPGADGSVTMLGLANFAAPATPKVAA